ncbi:MAG: DUF3536 domain-containing protein [Oscillatoriaceae bacterium SKYG93]|nr:DUF3536 domain-containing protein [Oscillatoriaceae bacterium SKYG93]MDW8453338.1 DUF3536 domain-containing protein [Oscillatoriaceae cyanobacterium SKYGB_i_bin93]
MSAGAATDAVLEKLNGAPVGEPLKVATGVYITVHGHFYQPPRENPYLDAIERQPGAAPFHDWNERIHYECYRPNAFARILNEQGELVGIVNNYEYMSFNIGPTLMSWLERHDVEVYQRILEADRKSCERLNGHGNALAQVYNHIIMPLANERDKYTQVRWGKADFRSRFGREPEGIWLAETAVDMATLKVLIDEGIKFTILAPSQAERCRPLPTEEEPEPEWHEVGGGQIDPSRPYRCFLPGGNRDRDYIDIFFYDGPISRDMGFNDVLSSAQHFAGRLGQAIHGEHRPSQLIAVATDGETFGHHKKFTEKCLAYCFAHEFPRRGWTVTNFAHYLSIHPPTWEVEIKPVTAWSCFHGVARWQDDCGCGSSNGWHQKWRAPLRNALNWLRDRLIEIYEQIGGELFRDPWLARDEYISVILDRSPENVKQFLSCHCERPLTHSEQVKALRLLEMQRHALLMYTSCGWFFEEISRVEGVQILRYAARAIELAADVANVQLENQFIELLALAPSNVEFYKDGAGVYRHLVKTAQISFEQVAAHYAISGLFTTYPPHERLYCYEAHQLDYHLQRMGPMTMAVGQVKLVSEITWENAHYVFAVLHLGGWDFHCCIQPFDSNHAYQEIKNQLFAALHEGSAAAGILSMVKLFGERFFSLRDLFTEERNRIMRLLSQETLLRLDQLYSQVYRENYGIIIGFQRDELPVPQELQVAAEIALGYRFLNVVKALEQEMSNLSNGEPLLGLNKLTELEAIAMEVLHLHCKLNIPEVKQILERLILQLLLNLLASGASTTLEIDVMRIERLITLGKALKLGLSLEQAQEVFFYWMQNQIASGSFQAKLQPLLQLGQKLAVDVSPCMKLLSPS